MEFKTRLNSDVGGSVAELQAMMKEFLLKHKLYRLLLRGKGLEFEAYRKYAEDDDSSAIDWKASARANTTLVKQYRDERNLKIVFIVDTGENMVFGSQKKLKCEYAAEVVGAFSHLIITTGDRSGVAFYGSKLKEYIKPSGGDKHFHQLVDRLTDASNYGGPSNFKTGLDFAIDYLNKNIDSVVFVSDFIGFNKSLVKPLATVASKFETVLLMIRDPLDNTLPSLQGEFVLEDPQSGQQLLVNPNVVGSSYKQITAKQKELIKKTCASYDIDLLEMETSRSLAPTLAEFLKGRIRKKEGR